MRRVIFTIIQFQAENLLRHLQRSLNMNSSLGWFLCPTCNATHLIPRLDDESTNNAFIRKGVSVFPPFSVSFGTLRPLSNTSLYSVMQVSFFNQGKVMQEPRETVNGLEGEKRQNRNKQRKKVFSSFEGGPQGLEHQLKLGAA